MSDGRYERSLVNAFDECGYVAMRAPASGAATGRDLPDMLVLREATALPDNYRPLTQAYAVELKTTKSTTAYMDADEGDALERFAAASGARAYFAARFKRPGKRTPVYLVRPHNCRMTDAGNYGVPEADADDRADLLVWAATETNPASIERVD